MVYLLFLHAAEKLSEKGIEVTVVNARFAKPLINNLFWSWLNHKLCNHWVLQALLDGFSFCSPWLAFPKKGKDAEVRL